jgi:hypothetical protein
VRAQREAERSQHIAEAAERRLAFLAEASARLAGSLDVEATLGTIAELAVPALADWCFVEVLEAGRRAPGGGRARASGDGALRPRARSRASRST